MGKKIGLNFFAFDTTMEFNFRLIEAEFGIKGFGVIVKLWQKIYGEKGYYIEFDDEIALLFADEIKVGGNLVSEIVRAAIKRGIFHQGLYEKYKILTSHGIQKRFLDGVSRRVRVEMEDRYLLLSVHEIPQNVYINGKNVDRNAENVYRNEQSRGEEKRLEEIRGERVTSAHGTYKNILLTEDEFNDLKKRYPLDYQKKINRLSAGIENKGYQYENHYETILAWAEEDQEREKKGKKSKFNNYKDGNSVDYDALEEKLLDEMVSKNAECRGGR